MRDTSYEPMDVFETRLARDLREAADVAVAPFDAGVIRRRAIADAPPTRRWRLVVERARWVILAAVLLLLAAVLSVVVATGMHNSRPAPLAFIRAGADVYVAESDGRGERRIVTGIEGGSQISDLDWSPDQRHLAALVVGDLTTKVLIVSPDGKLEGSFVGGLGMGIAWSPDSSRVAIHAASEPGEFVVVDPQGERLDSIAIPAGFEVGGIGWIGGWSGGFAWSPDGRWIAVPGCASGCDTKTDGHLIIVAADGSGARDLTTNPFGDSWIAWSRKGVLAAYRTCLSQATGCTPGIVEVSPDGQAPREILIPGDDLVGWLDWSPDGERLVAVTGAPGGLANELAVVEPDQSMHAIEIGTFSEVWRASWTSDGRAIVFSARRTPQSPTSIWSVGAAGGNPTQLVEDADPSIGTR